MSQKGEVVLLHRDSLMVVSLASVDESADHDVQLEDQSSTDTTVVSVELALQDGSTIRGDVSYLMPVSKRRLQDFLNTAERFVALRDGDLVHLVNKERIARVSTP